MIPLLALLGQTPELRRTMAGGPKDALIMAPPQAVGAANVGRIAWTADGGYLIVLRQSPTGARPPVAEVVVWGRRSEKSRSVLSFDPTTTRVNDLLPMGGSDRFVLDVTQKVREGDRLVDYKRISLVSASSGISVGLSLQKEGEGDPLIDAFPSPQRPIGILERIDSSTKKYRVFGPDGNLGPEISVPRNDGFRYDEDGSPVQIRRIEDSKGEGRTMERRIDLLTGATGEWRPRRRIPNSEKDAPVSVHVLTIEGGKGLRASGVLLALEGGKDEENGLVSTDGTDPVLSPKGDAVAYLDQSLAMVRTLERVDRRDYDEALRLQQIAGAVRRAKQVGLGLLQYAADHKDVLPGQGVDVRALTLSYVKDPAQYEGFSYTFGGGAQGDIEEIASTEMGYVSGPGGRAVIYTDGHVKWRSDP